ncbi:diaminopimelate epimerase [Jeotgalibacillus sp. S-D1]|uniref:diaminopimelate epimerase n=1 Tax=Jeotgalibacillus sp. S-D1 TaxID=2552189 RepID=UPI00105980F1|nr:diaminopimelate epimerase [Jeotgalibacillus sp. S-D1]TDL33154.1 diaminopimelate epimerase [Jeotgalibacillus sp. S-D1]
MKHEVDFIKFNPTQNMTILITTNHPSESDQEIASKIMSYDNVNAEQVGFIKKPNGTEAEARLKMAGGEFCGNACMSLAAFIANEKGVKEKNEILLEASGTSSIISCHVERNEDNFDCLLNMPLPETIEPRTIEYEGEEMEMTVVRYREFLHIVIEVDQFNERLRNKMEALARLLGLTPGASLIGILLYKSTTNEMAPLMYVPGLDSLIWERGCGSGTASIGAVLAWKKKGMITAAIKQPGGTMKVAADYFKEKVTSLTIEGSVGMVAKGKAFITI